MKLRRFIYGLLTITGIRKLGYFMPYRYASDLDLTPESYPWLYKWFSCLSKEIFLETLKSFRPYLDDLRQIQFKNCYLTTVSILLTEHYRLQLCFPNHMLLI